MARVTHVKKSQVSKRGPRTCSFCHKEIETGTPYKWFASRIGRSSIRKNYHAACPIPRSHTTTSQHLGALYDALDAASDALNGLGPFEDKGDVESIMEEAADQIQEVADGYTESADNMVEGFGHETSMSEEIREKASEVEQFAGEVRDFSPDDFDEDSARTEAAEETTEEENSEAAEEDIEARVEEKRQEWRDEIVSDAESVLAGSPF